MTPPNDMIMWLREVLITANTEELLDVAARVLAERAIIDLHEPQQVYRRAAGEHVNTIGVTVPNFEPIPNRFHCRLCSDADDGGEPWPCPTLRWLAYGHRYDAPGWRHEWTPDGGQP